MNAEEKRVRKVLKFYKSLPDDLLNNIFNDLELNNRNMKRKFKGIKLTDKKIEFLFSINAGKELANISYRLIKDNIPLTLETSTYDDIIA